MSSLIRYPDSLPRPLLKPISFAQQANLLVTPMESGRRRVRRRFKTVPTVMNITWNCKSSQAALLEGFIEHALEGGARPFEMLLLTPQGHVLHEVRFIKDPRENYKPLSGTYWEYAGVIEIKQRQQMSEQDVAGQVLSPNTAQEFVTGVKNAVESYED